MRLNLSYVHTATVLKPITRERIHRPPRERSEGEYRKAETPRVRRFNGTRVIVRTKV